MYFVLIPFGKVNPTDNVTPEYGKITPSVVKLFEP